MPFPNQTQYWAPHWLSCIRTTWCWSGDHELAETRCWDPASRYPLPDAEIQPQDILCQWTSAFNGVSVIFNRLTPPHRDGKSRKQWYNLLVSIGNYRNCNLELPGAGTLVEYSPGTVVGLLGSTPEHTVANFEGERVCYAYFMRDSMHEWAGVPSHSWMATQQYQ